MYPLAIVALSTTLFLLSSGQVISGNGKTVVCGSNNIVNGVTVQNNSPECGKTGNYASLVIYGNNHTVVTGNGNQVNTAVGGGRFKRSNGINVLVICGNNNQVDVSNPSSNDKIIIVGTGNFINGVAVSTNAANCNNRENYSNVQTSLVITGDANQARVDNASKTSLVISSNTNRVSVNNQSQDTSVVISSSNNQVNVNHASKTSVVVDGRDNVIDVSNAQKSSLVISENGNRVDVHNTSLRSVVLTGNYNNVITGDR